MNCEQCGGDCWDNRSKNRERIANGERPMPDFTCKDKNGCGWKKWPPRNNSGGGNRGGGGQRGNAPPKIQRPLGPLYLQCMKVAKGSLDAVQGKGNYSGADLTAATATVFIAARDGAPIMPPPKREVEEADSNNYQENEAGDHDDAIPF